jgi:uncharacterized protein (TIGR00296 family)
MSWAKMLDAGQKKKLLKIAREAILDEKFSTKDFPEKLGVFVTLHSPKGELRGCIGFPEAVHSLGRGVVDAARFAAYEDFRFESVKKGEKFVIEISVLTKPQLIAAKKAEDYLGMVGIGKDGLIIKTDYSSGLLLPQVAVEWGWGVKEFLENLCLKAGLEKNSWKDLKNRIYKFQAEVFSEGNL